MNTLQGYESSDSNEEVVLFASKSDSAEIKQKSIAESSKSVVDYFSPQPKIDEEESTAESCNPVVDYFSLQPKIDEEESTAESCNPVVDYFSLQPKIDEEESTAESSNLVVDGFSLQPELDEEESIAESSNSVVDYHSLPAQICVSSKAQNIDVSGIHKNISFKPGIDPRGIFSKNCKKIEKYATDYKKEALKRHSPHKNKTDPNQRIVMPVSHLYPYVSKIKKLDVRNEQHKVISKNAIGSNMFTTPTLISTNLENESSTIPRREYITFNEAHSASITCVKWNIPRYSHLFFSTSFDNSIKIWECVDVNACVSLINSHTNAIKDAKWSKCGHKILSAGFHKSILIHDVQTGSCLNSFQTSSRINCLQYHPTESSLFLAGLYDSAIYCYDTRSGKMITEYKGNFGEVLDVEFISNGYEFVSANSIVGRDTANRTLMVWDFRIPAVVSNQIYHEKYTCPYLKSHPKDNVFLAQSNANYIAIFSSTRPYKLNKFRRFEGHKIEGYPIGFDISPDGKIIASGSSDGSVYFYNYKNSKLIKRLRWCRDGDVCIDVAYHPVISGVVATCSWKGRLTVWQ